MKLLFALWLAAVAVPVAAEDAAASSKDRAPAAVEASGGAAKADAATKPAEKNICKRDESSGTRLAPKRCLTAAQWRRQSN